MAQKINGVSEMMNLLSQDWFDVIGYEFGKPYWNDIIDVLNNTPRYLPDKKYIFNALNSCKPQDVKVVIIGQDPYIHANEPHGFSFSVKPDVKVPPSLNTVFKELMKEYNMDSLPRNGCLIPWESEGVLLLNVVLTVKEGMSNSHKGIGWEKFTSAVIKYLDTNNKVVFMAWGAKAQQVCSNEVKNNEVLTAGHPSPMNTVKPFLGCGCFREANRILMKNNILPVRWTKIWK